MLILHESHRRRELLETEEMVQEWNTLEEIYKVLLSLPIY